MEKEELMKLQEAMQQCCDDWVFILALQRWNIKVEICDDIFAAELPALEYDPSVAAAKITMPTGDVWKSVYPDFWAPYNMEVHLVAQLLELMAPKAEPMTRYYLARVLFGLKARISDMQQIIQNMQHQDTIEEPVKENTEEAIIPEPVDETESD